MGLRVDPRSGSIVFTWPLKSRMTTARALAFIHDSQDWIARQKINKLPVIAFTAGAEINIAGRGYIITPAAGRGVTRFEGDRLIVHGQPEHLSRRIKDFLKKLAEEELQRLTDAKCKTLGIKTSLVQIRDPKTRWGSCGPDGRIMYSWRLILAPPAVMDYVVAHEVAHRIHLNHSRRFWALCQSLSAQDAASSRQWLRRDGRGLMGAG